MSDGLGDYEMDRLVSEKMSAVSEILTEVSENMRVGTKTSHGGLTY